MFRETCSSTDLWLPVYLSAHLTRQPFARRANCQSKWKQICKKPVCTPVCQTVSMYIWITGHTGQMCVSAWVLKKDMHPRGSSHVCYSVCDSFSFPCLNSKLTQFGHKQGVALLRIVSGGTSIPRFVLNYKWCQGYRVCFTGNKCSRKHLFFYFI